MRSPGHWRVAAGFTLIELLVVVVVVSIMVSVVVISLGGRNLDEALAREAERLRLTVDLGRERAEIEAREWGLDVDASGYRFLVYDEASGTWQPAVGAPWSRHALDARLELQIDVDTVQVSVDDANGVAAEGAATRTTTSLKPGERPEALLLSSGEASAFRITLAAREGTGSWIIDTDGISRMRAQSAAELAAAEDDG